MFGALLYQSIPGGVLRDHFIARSTSAVGLVAEPVGRSVVKMSQSARRQPFRPSEPSN